MKNDQFALMQQISLDRKGCCLSRVYESAKAKLLFQCAKGHQWKASPDKIKKGTWCPFCAGRGKNLDTLNSLAIQFSGKCLSTKYLGTNTLHLWQCRSGHIFKLRPNDILQYNTWCQKCKKELILQKIHEYAHSRGGKCLSEQFISSKTPLEFECHNGHRWFSKSTFYNKSWCPYCSKFSFLSEEKTRYIFEQLLHRKFATNRSEIGMELDGYNQELEIAFEYNGEMHYEFIKRFHKTQYQLKRRQNRDIEKTKLCSDLGIKLIVIPYWINTSDQDLFNFIVQQLKVDATWKESFLIPFYKNQNSKIEEMRAIALSRGGIFVSNSYFGSTKKHSWRCNNGHTWDSTPTSIKKSTWCPVCAQEKLWNNSRNSLDDLNKFASKYNGNILSKSYINNKTLLKWECQNGHTWTSSLNTMRTRVNKSGKWCLYCKELNYAWATET